MDGRDGCNLLLIGAFAGALAASPTLPAFADARQSPTWQLAQEPYAEAAPAGPYAADQEVLVPPGFEADEPLSDTPSEDGTRRGMEIRPEGDADGQDDAPSGCKMREGPLELLV